MSVFSAIFQIRVSRDDAHLFSQGITGSPGIEKDNERYLQFLLAGYNDVLLPVRILFAL